VGNPENAAIVARRILYEMEQPYELEDYEISITTKGCCKEWCKVQLKQLIKA
jgi:hypothetical protein